MYDLPCQFTYSSEPWITARKLLTRQGAGLYSAYPSPWYGLPAQFQFGACYQIKEWKFMSYLWSVRILPRSEGIWLSEHHAIIFPLDQSLWIFWSKLLVQFHVLNLEKGSRRRTKMYKKPHTYLPASKVNHVVSRPYRRRALSGQEMSLTLGFWMSQRQMYSYVICKAHSPCTSKLGDGIKYTLNLSGRKTKG